MEHAITKACSSPALQSMVALQASFLVEIHLACEAMSMDQGSEAIKLFINDLYSREVCLYTHNNYITRWYITASFPGLELVGLGTRLGRYIISIT